MCLMFDKLDITGYDRCENLVENDVLCFFCLGGVDVKSHDLTEPPPKSNMDTQNSHV